MTAPCARCGKPTPWSPVLTLRQNPDSGFWESLPCAECWAIEDGLRDEQVARMKARLIDGLMS